MDNNHTNKISRKILLAGIKTLLVLAPFSAFLVIALSNVIGYGIILREWKGLLLLVMLAVLVVQILNDRELARTLFRNRLNQFIFIYALILVFVTILDHPSRLFAVLFGFLIDLRFLAILFAAQSIGFYKDISIRQIKILVALISAGVVTFGIFQIFVLPYNFLSNIGYDAQKTIPPFFTIDGQITQLRIASTLRGPNELGAFLIIPIVFAVHYFIKYWKQLGRFKKEFMVTVISFVSLLVVLYSSQSRSAWVGVIVSVLIYALIRSTNKARVIVITLGITLSVMGLGIGYKLRNSQFIQNVVLHDNPRSGPVETSNSGRRAAQEKALKEIIKDPVIGCGVGCAGPASVHTSDPKISENYYLQIAQEAGVFALIVFLIICTSVSYILFKISKSSPIGAIWLASFLGLAVCNMFLHTWADDTIAYVWWAVAGLLIGSYSRLDYETASAKHLRTSD